MAHIQKQILVADDEETALCLMRAVLEKSGFKVTTALNGAEALCQFRKQPYDMVMLDVNMPLVNGFEALVVLRKEFGNNVPILMVTGMEDTDSVEKAYECGATDFIAKPINWSLIGHRVSYLLRAYQNIMDLQTANDNNKAILAAIPDTLFRIDNSGIVMETYNKTKDYFVLSGHSLADSFPSEITANLTSKINQARNSRTIQHLNFTLKGNHGNEQYYETQIVAINDKETLCLVRDITERKVSEHKIFRFAYFDMLTGLPNRRFFLDKLQQKIDDISQHEIKLLVLSIGLDRFKTVNETMGYATGNHILQLAANRLRENFSPFYVINELARPGGDEFIVLTQIDQEHEAIDVADNIRKIMYPPFSSDRYTIILTSSVGIAIYPENGKDAETLLRNSFSAMNSAKKNGRDNSQLYDSSLTHQAESRLLLENNLRVALERNEFNLLYQPQFNLYTGHIFSVEALLRWHHPEQGIISPVDFIPLAEENGLIVPIGVWVLRTACMMAANIQQSGYDLHIAVNLSPKQFKDPNLIKDIVDILAETKLNPKLLELEITEGCLMEDNENTLKTINNLREKGISISLDDFGTGYSSMSYLKQLPLNNLKIDQSFIKGLPRDTDSLAIVSAIISMAKQLGFSITAEGVETLEQAQILKQLSSDILQGYYFSKPIKCDEIVPLLYKKWNI